jgi:hypothetical protein
MIFAHLWGKQGLYLANFKVVQLIVNLNGIALIVLPIA